MPRPAQALRSRPPSPWLLIILCLAMSQPLSGALAQDNPAPPPAGSREALQLELPYVRAARVHAEARHDLGGQTLVLEFGEPQAVLSTLAGFKAGLRRVGNHSLPPSSWPRLGQLSLEQLEQRLWGGLGWEAREGTLLITGARMEHLSVQSAQAQGLKAVALVTAGAAGNAMRMAADQGEHVEPGTINIILLTNRALSQGAMARAVITATEAKTAALQDLDVRSSYAPWARQATGTGTDEVLVVAGQGVPLESTGGHTLMGTLLARAVYAGVRQALAGQNGLTLERGLARRLQERGVACPSLELLLARPGSGGFLAQALALEDAWRRGLWDDLPAWRLTCQERAAGQPATLGQASGERTWGPLALALLALGCPPPEQGLAP